MADQYKSREERRKQQTSKPKKKKSSKGIFKRIFLILVALGIIGMIAGAATFAFMVKDAPELDPALLKDPIPSVLLDKNGDELTKVGAGKLDYVDYEDIPELVENAFLATEDVRFYEHNGMDLIRLGGAVIANVTRGFGSEGASTITQQVVKNSFLNNEKTISRKAQEAWLSFQLERKYTKQEIFEMYVNKIFMSENSHGVLTASRIYFGKELDELELHEAALLAGMPQSPNNYNPFNHPEQAEKRRNIVLSLMNQHGFINESEMKEAQAKSVTDSLVAEAEREKDDSPYDSFVDVVIDEVSAKYPDLDIFSDGLIIHTTVDKKAQKHVTKLLNSDEVIQYPDDEFQAGITLLDSNSGEIRAIGGGRNQEVKRGFNYATDLKRQAGSTFKPIAAYGPAVDSLKWGTYHTLVDEPHTYKDGGQNINNWNKQFSGPMTMRQALAQSKNIPAVKARQEVGEEDALKFVNNLGFNLENLYESAALGTPEVSPMQMAGAYSAFANEGYYTEPHSVTEIEMRDGTKIDLTPETEAVMNDYTAFMISDMLKTAVTSGTGTMANVPGLPVAGKTGTTNYTGEEKAKHGIPDGAVPDAWFAGYTTNYTAAIWTGYEDRKNYVAANNYDQKIAQLLFKDLMQTVSEGTDTADFKMPNSVEKVAIEKGSNPAKLASDYTPSDQIITEYAVKGNAPSQVSVKYDKLDAPSGLSAKYDEESKQISLSWDYSGEENVQYVVTASINDGGEQELTTTGEKSLTVDNPEPGATYSFKVKAVKDDMASDPATASVSIPGNEEEEEIPEDEENPDEEKEENPGDNEGEGNGNENGNENGNGNGNGNGNENGNGNGNGNENGNGNGNENGNGNGEENPDEGGAPGEGEGETPPENPGETNPGNSE